MQTKTICTIRNMLKEWKTGAYQDYVRYSEYLENKYGVKYHVLASEEEREKWLHMRSVVQDSQDALNDFENHEWK